MKTVLKTLALVATLVGLASCGSRPVSQETGYQPTQFGPGAGTVTIAK